MLVETHSLDCQLLSVLCIRQIILLVLLTLLNGPDCNIIIFCLAYIFPPENKINKQCPTSCQLKSLNLEYHLGFRNTS